MSQQRCCRMNAIALLMLHFSLTLKIAQKRCVLETKFVWLVLDYKYGKGIYSLLGKIFNLDTLRWPCLCQMQLKLGNMLLVNSHYFFYKNKFEMRNHTFPNSHWKSSLKNGPTRRQQKARSYCLLQWSSIACSYALSGRDCHVSAQFSCTSNANNTIGGSFFFEPLFCPKGISVGDVVQLIDVDIQQWNGAAQLWGKNVRMVAHGPSAH